MTFATGQNFTSFVDGIKATLPGGTVHLTFANIPSVGTDAVLFQDRSHGIVGIIADLGSRDLYVFAGLQAPPTAAQVEALANQLLQPTV